MRLFRWIASLFLMLPVLVFSETPRRFFFDENRVRYELVQTNGSKPYNWLFLPGGPGSDSSYLQSLVDLLNLPGNVWFIDLPGSGTNKVEDEAQDYNQWLEIFPQVIDKFSNPILVGHSFGGMFPLLFPQLEQSLKGFIVLHSTPSLWQEAALEYAKRFSLPSFDAEIAAFSANPSKETFEAALEACTPYYFPPSGIEAGRKLFAQTVCQYEPALWWLKKATEMNFTAKWVPERVPALIIGGKYDCMCPFSVYQNDSRFDRENVTLLFIKNGGHCSWLDNPKAIQKAFAKFIRGLDLKRKKEVGR